MAAPDQAAQLLEIARRNEKTAKLKQIALLVQKEQQGKILSAREQKILDEFRAPETSNLKPETSNPSRGRGGRLDALRWTIEKAASEFDINPRTLVKNLKSASIEPGEDGKFSTVQICDAIFGDLRGEYIRAQTAVARKDYDIKCIKEAELNRELIPIAPVARIWNSMLADLRNKISYTGLSDQEKSDICKDLQDVPIEEYFNTVKADEEGAD